MTSDLIERIESAAGHLTEAELIDRFRQQFNWQGPDRLTAKEWASVNGFREAYVSDVLHGRRGIADRIAAALGYDRVVTFVPTIRARKAGEA